MARLAPRSNASGRQYGCPRRAILGVHGWVAVTSSGRQHRGSLLGYLHSHGPVDGLADLPSIQCLRPWPSGGVEKNGGEEGSIGVLDWSATACLKSPDGIGCQRGGPSADIEVTSPCVGWRSRLPMPGR
jgi:hypothetical protein